MEGKKNMKKPLEIYVLWHQNYVDGAKHANEIYRNFTRDIENPISRGIGIPVYFRNKTLGDKIINDISYEKSEHIAVVVFIDNYMVNDDSWKKSLMILEDDKSKNDNIMIYPVAINENSYKIGIYPTRNYIRLYKFDKEQQLINWITHELCRLLYNRARIAEVNDIGLTMSPQPITLFISHAKDGGASIAEQIDSYINRSTALKTFFDATDIAPGYDFDKEIEANIYRSVLMIVHTDKYSSREWCRKEVLIAKKYSCPIIVINMFENGEDRIFPYMANVRSIRIEQPIDTNKLETIIFYALKDTLKFKYYQLYLNYLIDTFKITLEPRGVISTPPELISLLYMKNADSKYIIYPDPPLGDEEVDILNQYNPNIRFITPTFLPLANTIDDVNAELDTVFSKINVGISISESQDITSYGFENMHLKDFLVELSRYLLATGTKLVYGGDIKYNALGDSTTSFNFSSILFDLAQNYNKENKKACEKIDNYVAFPLYANISEGDKATIAEVAKIIEIEPIEQSKHYDAIEMLRKDLPEKRYLISENLSNMRSILSKNVTAAILVGGKTKNYIGKYPGLFEEAHNYINSNIPIYIIGSFGGASKAIIDALHGEIPEEFTLEYHMQNEDYKKLVEYYQEQGEKGAIDFGSILKVFNSKGIEGLNNGLSVEENELLFKATDFAEAISLILKGLAKISNVDKPKY